MKISPDLVPSSAMTAPMSRPSRMNLAYGVRFEGESSGGVPQQKGILVRATNRLIAAVWVWSQNRKQARAEMERRDALEREARKLVFPYMYGQLKGETFNRKQKTEILQGLLPIYNQGMHPRAAIELLEPFVNDDDRFTRDSLMTELVSKLEDDHLQAAILVLYANQLAEGSPRPVRERILNLVEALPDRMNLALCSATASFMITALPEQTLSIITAQTEGRIRRYLAKKFKDDTDPVLARKAEAIAKRG